MCSAYTSGSISHQGGSASFGINFGISSSIGGVGTFTNYAVPFQDGAITLRSQSFVGTLSSISIKEASTTKFFNLAGTDSIDSNTLKLLHSPSAIQNSLIRPLLRLLIFLAYIISMLALIFRSL